MRPDCLCSGHFDLSQPVFKHSTGGCDQSPLFRCGHGLGNHSTIRWHRKDLKPQPSLALCLEQEGGQGGVGGWGLSLEAGVGEVLRWKRRKSFICPVATELNFRVNSRCSHSKKDLAYSPLDKCLRAEGS